MKTPITKKIKHPALLDKAYHLSAVGKVKVSKNKLMYLDIDDEFVHGLFPLLKNIDVTKPNYFTQDSAGAHITIIYPEETTKFKNEDLNQEHRFTISDIASVSMAAKTYYVLLVNCPTLLALRRKYRLPDLLNFKGYEIGFHITIGNHYAKIHD